MGTNLGDLLRNAGLQASESAPAPEAPAAPEAEPEAVHAEGKVVVRMTRKGRGGKTVTTVSGLEGDLKPLLKKLKKQLGTGARLEDALVVIQGDHVERVARWLESQGFDRVVRG